MDENSSQVNQADQLLLEPVHRSIVNVDCQNSSLTLKLSFWKISSGIIDFKSSKSELIEFVSSEAKDDADEKSDIC